MALSFPFPINTSDPYHQGPFGYSRGSWLSRPLRGTNRFCIEKRPAGPKMSALPRLRNHPAFAGMHQGRFSLRSPQAHLNIMASTGPIVKVFLAVMAQLPHFFWSARGF